MHEAHVVHNEPTLVLQYLSWQTGWCPAALRTCCGAAGEHLERLITPFPKTLAGCKTTEFHQDQLIPSGRPRRRGPAWTAQRSGEPRPVGCQAGSSGPTTAPYSDPVSPGCQSRCTSEADGWRCSSAGGCYSPRSLPERFSPKNVNFPTTLRLASPS